MKSLLYISFLYSISWSLSQSPTVLLEVSNLQPKVGEYITVQMTSSKGSNFELNFPDEFQSGMNVMSGMRQKFVNGRKSTFYYQTISGFFMEPGSYDFGPVKVRAKKKSYKSNKLRVVVKGVSPKDKNEKKNASPRSKLPAIFAETKPSQLKIYRGEPVYLQSSIFSKKEFSSIRNYNPYKIDAKYDEFKMNASKDLDWVRVVIEGQEYLKLQFEENVIFLNESGKATVDPFEMVLAGYGSYAVRSEATSIEVLDLPEDKPLSFAGLVGDFQLKVTLSDSNAKANDIISLAIEINGRGNLHQMSKPSLGIPKSLELYSDPIKTENYRLTKSGFKGNIIYTYPIRVLQDGYIHIPPVEISFFNPKSNIYEAMRSKKLELNEASNNSKSPESLTKLKTDDGIEVQVSSKMSKPSDNDLWLNPYLLSSLLVLLLIILFFIGKQRKWFEVKRKSIQAFQPPKINQVQSALELAIEPSGSVIESIGLMEQCLFTYCSYLLSQDSVRLSRNEIYLLLSNHISHENMEDIRQLFTALDTFRYSRDTSLLSFEELRDTFQKQVSQLLVQ